MAPRKRPERDDLAGRIRHIVAIDAATVIRRLRERHREMVTLFSRLRDRAPLLETIQSWFETATFSELAALAPAEQQAVTHFYG